MNDDPEVHLPTTRQPPEIVQLELDDDDVIVVYDLETTALGRGAEFTQVAASTTDQKQKFDQYILPVGNISYGAREITGLSKNKDGKLVNRNSDVIPAVPIKEGISNFLSFLKNVKETRKGKIVLVGHNANGFDNKHTIWALEKTGKLEEAKGLIAGFSDTLPLFREKCPDMPKHKVSALYEKFVGKEFIAHNAAEDVRAVVEIIVAAKVKPADFIPYSSTFQSATDILKFDDETNAIKESLAPLHENDIISKYMARKMALEGLSFDKLLSVYREQGPEALKVLIQERVTKTSRIIDALVAYFGQFNEGIIERSYADQTGFWYFPPEGKKNECSLM